MIRFEVHGGTRRDQAACDRQEMLVTDDLDNNLRDYLVSASRGAAGLVPYIGGPLGELISHTIPKQRLDRLVQYVRELEQRLQSMEEQVVQEALNDPRRIDLVETGGYQAARSVSTERIVWIAELVFQGLQKSDVDILRHKRLMNLLEEVDDDELLLLNAYGQNYGAQNQEAWGAVNRPSPGHLGSSTAELDAEKLFELGQDRLLRLGLLRKNIPRPKQGNYPEFDPNTGSFKGRVEISYLGRMLLREIGLLTSDE